MKWNYLFTALFSLAFSQPLLAYKSDESWLAKPSLHKVYDSFAKESAVVILERELIDYTKENEQAFVFNTIHRIVKVLDDKGIEQFNKITITNNGLSVSDIRIRTILPDGTTIEAVPSKILEVKSEDNKQQFVYAVEGLEKGAEIEMIYTAKYAFGLFGSEYFQFGVPVERAEFVLRSPAYFIFETKGYNGFPSATDSVNADSSSDYGRIYFASADRLPAMEEEPSSNYYANLMRIDYRIAYLPESKPNQRQFTWNDLAATIYEQNYILKEKESKQIRKYLKTIGVDKMNSELDKIRKIEDDLKTNISMSDDLDESYEQFDVIFSKKITTEAAFRRLMMACMLEAGVEVELGITSDKYVHPVDDKFEIWKYLEYYVLYFPKQKQYTCVTAVRTRMPFVPVNFLNNNAVFCKLSTLGSMTSAVASVRRIQPMPTEMSRHDLDATVTFAGDELVPHIEQKQSLSGYAAMGMRELFLYVPKEQEKDYLAQIVDIAAGKDDISAYTINNTALSNYYDNKPLEIITTLTAPKLMEHAGPKYLFKVGDVIGRQAEMYHEKKRKMPIEAGYPHVLVRTIRVKIPESYKVSNPEILNKNILEKENGKEVMGFVSSYELKGKELLIHIREFYDKMELPASEIDPFVRVINAAADFNKLILVLEKQ